MLPFLNVLHNLLFNTGILLVCYKTIFILIFLLGWKMETLLSQEFLGPRKMMQWITKFGFSHYKEPLYRLGWLINMYLVYFLTILPEYFFCCILPMSL